MYCNQKGKRVLIFGKKLLSRGQEIKSIEKKDWVCVIEEHGHKKILLDVIILMQCTIEDRIVVIRIQLYEIGWNWFGYQMKNLSYSNKYILMHAESYKKVSTNDYINDSFFLN